MPVFTKQPLAPRFGMASVFTLTIQQFLIISPFVFYSFLGGLALWTLLYSRKGREEIEVILRPSDTATEVSTTEETVA